MRIKRIHHLTLAVRDLDGARLTFEQLFGVQGERTSDVASFGVRIVDVPIGDSVLQLAAPQDADNPVMRFLERRGEGFYNLALEIEDLDETVRELASQGVRVSEPIEVEPGLRSAFVTMAATHGLSVQLVEIVGAEPIGAADSADADDDPLLNASEAGQTEAEEAAAAPLDLTPDEWSDVD